MKSTYFTKSTMKYSVLGIFLTCFIMAVIVRLAKATEPTIIVTLNGLNVSDKATLHLLPDGESETVAAAFAEQGGSIRNCV